MRWVSQRTNIICISQMELPYRKNVIDLQAKDYRSTGPFTDACVCVCVRAWERACVREYACTLSRSHKLTRPRSHTYLHASTLAYSHKSTHGHTWQNKNPFHLSLISNNRLHTHYPEYPRVCQLNPRKPHVIVLMSFFYYPPFAFRWVTFRSNA